MPESLVTLARQGDQRAIARLATWIENREPRGLKAVASLYPYAGRAQVVGITGPPGAGKSSLIDKLIPQFRAIGKQVGVVAVDPSSVRTGGATLGDRVRMHSAYGDAGVFVRSMASRGETRGIALGTAGIVHLLDAAGFDIILVETVGVGQEQIDIAGLAHTVVLLQVPGSGDAVQFLKAGVLEHADLIVVNKSDLPGASTLQKDLRGAITEAASLASGWSPQILATSTVNDSGFGELREAVDQHWLAMSESGELEKRNQNRAIREIMLEAQDQLAARLRLETSNDLDDLATQVASHRLAPADAASALLVATGDNQ